MCSRGLHSGLWVDNVQSLAPVLPGTSHLGWAVGRSCLPPLPGNFMSLLEFCQEQGQRRTTDGESLEGRESRKEERERASEEGQKLLTVEDARETSRGWAWREAGIGQGWLSPFLFPSLSLILSPSVPPSPSLPSSHRTSLLVRVIVLICMSGKALLHTQKENPSHGGVAVSALAVVRQCKIKLIKPPTQENITGN